jgi:uncharacterized OB-fold protein
MDKPVVLPTALTQPYWDAAAAGRLAIQRCGSCRRFVHFPRPRCPGCGSAELSFEPVSGKGTVETFTVIHRSFVPGFEGPYVAAWIALPEQEGLRAFGNVTGCSPNEVSIGMPVEVWFEPRGDVTMPNFRKIQ